MALTTVPPSFDDLWALRRDARRSDSGRDPSGVPANPGRVVGPGALLSGPPCVVPRNWTNRPDEGFRPGA